MNKDNLRKSINNLITSICNSLITNNQIKKERLNGKYKNIKYIEVTLQIIMQFFFQIYKRNFYLYFFPFYFFKTYILKIDKNFLIFVSFLYIKI